MLKKLILPILSLFLLYRSIELMRYLAAAQPSEFSLAESVFLAFILNLFITGVFAFIGFAYPTNRLLPKSFYTIKHSHFIKRLYKFLGLKYFRILLLFFFWGHKKNRQKYFDGSKAGLDNFIYQTKQSEFGHFAAFVLIFLCCMILLFNQYYLVVAIATFLNLIGNFYPVILQRHHRIRIEKISSILK